MEEKRPILFIQKECAGTLFKYLNTNKIKRFSLITAKLMHSIEDSFHNKHPVAGIPNIPRFIKDNFKITVISVKTYLTRYID